MSSADWRRFVSLGWFVRFLDWLWDDDPIEDDAGAWS